MSGLPRNPAGAVQLLEEIRQLLTVKGENPFKIRAYDRASDAIAGRDDLMALAKMGRLTSIDGVGKGIAQVLTDFLLSGKTDARDELLESLPEGILELVKIPGLGPKKAMTLIDELDIHSLRELEYACKENRLLTLKGFGIKAQHKILEGIQQMTAYAGKKRLADAFPAAEALFKILQQEANGCRVSETGELRRRMEVLSGLEFLVEMPAEKKEKDRLSKKLKAAVDRYRESSGEGLEIVIHESSPARFGYELARTTGSPEHWKALGTPAPFDAKTEEAFYEKLSLPWIPPEAREDGEEVPLAKKGKLEELLPWNGVQGIFHNHTTRSDGMATLENMVVEAKRLGFKYIGISDHSQSAYYAQGLKPADLNVQEKEVRQVQEKHPEIRIFWGIESDILADGSLDYDEKVLKKFDFVIASIHSRFKMDKEAMTDRILEAIRNPCTRFLGHATGRLLLGRKGYDVHMDRIIAEAAKRDVAIEINASPARLDIDWRWGKMLRQCETKVSINPDAHDTSEIADTMYGIGVARKALLPVSQVVNSRSVKEVEKWLSRS